MSRSPSEAFPKLPTIPIGTAEFDPTRSRVRVAGGEWTKLRRQSAAILRLLADRRGEVVSKAELHAAVWGCIAVTDDSLVQCVVEVRRGLGPERDRLSTVSGAGYCLEGSAAGPRERPIVAPSVAVLACADPALERRWGSALTGFVEDLAFDLSRRGLRVIALPAGARIGAFADFAGLARSVGSDYLVPCRLTAAGQALRIIVQLLHASTGETAWVGRHFVRRDEAGAQLGVRSAAIAGLIGGIEGDLVRLERHRLRLAASPVDDPYGLYLLAGEGLETDSRAAALEATALAERCVALAPRFARGWLMLNWRRNRLYSYGWGDTGTDRLFREAAVFRRAAELDPRDPLALGFLAVSEAKVGDLGKAKHLVDAAVEAAANLPDAGAELSFPLAAVAGRPQLGLLLLDRALDHHPRPLDHWGYMESRAAFLAGDNVRAVAAAYRSPDCLPKLVFQTLAAAALDDENAALASHRQLLELRPGFDFTSYARDLPIADPAARQTYEVAHARLVAHLAISDSGGRSRC